MCTLNPAYVEQQPIKIEQDITKIQICLKLRLKVAPKVYGVVKCSGLDLG